MPTAIEFPATGKGKDPVHSPGLDVNAMKKRAAKLHVAPKFSFLLLMKMLFWEFRHRRDTPETGSHKTIDL